MKNTEKKQYEAPKAEVVAFAFEDIIVASGTAQIVKPNDSIETELDPFNIANS